MGTYIDEAAEAIRRMMQGAGVVLPPPGAVQAARRVDGPMPDFSNVRGLDVAPGLDAPDFSKIVDNGVPVDPDFNLGTSLWDQMNRGQQAYDNLRTGRTANLRNQPFAGIGGQAIRDAEAKLALHRRAMAASAEQGEMLKDAGMIGAGVAGAGAIGAGGLMLATSGVKPETPSYTTDIDLPVAQAPAPTGSAADPLFAPAPALTSTDGTAELVSQTRPAPEVQASTDPREQAQEMIAQLNQMHRAGTIAPDQDRQMRAEIDRLLAISNQRRNAMPAQQAAASSDPHMQAQAIIAKLNAMRAAQPGGGEVPQAGQMMAEVRRLQAMGDQRRNAMQTR